MLRFILTTPVSQEIAIVKEGFNVDLFRALKPPFLKLTVMRFDGCEKDDQIHLKMGLGIQMSWISIISEHGYSSEEWYFVDMGEKLPPPLKYWKHRHRVLKKDKGGSIIVDDISYSSGVKILDYLIYLPLKYLFKLRAPIYKKFFGKA